MGKCLDYWEHRSVNLKKTELASRNIVKRLKCTLFSFPVVFDFLFLCFKCL